ncbi:MAG: phosphatase PAP2 family protein [Bacteroidota bacterium]
MFDSLEKLDQKLFLFLNGCHNNFFDVVMWWVSSIYVWIPIYALFIYLLIRRYKIQAVYLIILAVLIVIITDKLSVIILKNTIQRYRPTHNLEIGNLVHILNNYRGGLYGFVSSHAANGFAVACIMSMYIRKRIFVISVFLWAALVSYSRIYLGVHYFSDILCGGIFGITIACIIFYIFNIFFKRKYPDWNKIK